MGYTLTVRLPEVIIFLLGALILGITIHYFWTSRNAIRIDKQVFHDRLSHFISAWKADKRSGDALFGGAGSIVVMMGRTEESSAFQKNNSMHVSCICQLLPAL